VYDPRFIPRDSLNTTGCRRLDTVVVGRTRRDRALKKKKKRKENKEKREKKKRGFQSRRQLWTQLYRHTHEKISATISRRDENYIGDPKRERDHRRANNFVYWDFMKNYNCFIAP